MIVDLLSYSTDRGVMLFTGKDLWRLRKEAGLTRQELAEMSNISNSTINDFEHERRDLRISSLNLILDALEYELDLVKRESRS